MSMGGWEWVILAVLALLLFGGSRLAGFGKNAGKSIREFKEEVAVLRSPELTSAPAPEVAPPEVAAPVPAEAEPVNRS